MPSRRLRETKGKRARDRGRGRERQRAEREHVSLGSFSGPPASFLLSGDTRSRAGRRDPRYVGGGGGYIWFMCFMDLASWKERMNGLIPKRRKGKETPI